MITKEEIQKKNEEFGRTFIKPFLTITFGALILLLILIVVLSRERTSATEVNTSVENKTPDVIFESKNVYKIGYGYVGTREDGSKYMIVFRVNDKAGGVAVVDNI